MSTRASIMAVVAALFGLQIPLCALACGTDVQPALESQSAASSAHDMPCHAAEEPEATGAGGGSHEECDCGSWSPLVLAETGAASPISTAQLASHRAPSVGSEAPPAARCLVLEGAARIPPRDILLLKSTLLI